MTSYEYRIPGLQKVPAQVVGEVCEALEHSEEGLSPATLVAASRADDAPLHREFEWDDDKAAGLYREHQASGIIRNLRVTIKTTEGKVEKVRAFISIKQPEVTGNYVTLARTLDNDAWRQQLLEDAKRDAEAFMQKYRVLGDVVADAISALQKLVA